jgi:hypothetical protein
VVRLVSIGTDDVREYVARRQAATESVRQAYTIKRKDGTEQTNAEHRRRITGASNASINRELTALKGLFTLAIEDHGGGGLQTGPGRTSC